MPNITNRTTDPNKPTFRIRISRGKNPDTQKYEYISETFHGSEEEVKEYAKKLENEILYNKYKKAGQMISL